MEILPDDPSAFLAAVEPLARRDEAARLDALFREATGWAPRVWTGRIVGYGVYAYRHAGGQAGRAPVTGFSPRAAKLSLYVTPGFAGMEDLLARLGRHESGVSCLYLRRLDDADPEVLAEMIRAGAALVADRLPVEPG